MCPRNRSLQMIPIRTPILILTVLLIERGATDKDNDTSDADFDGWKKPQ